MEHPKHSTTKPGQILQWITFINKFGITIEMRWSKFIFLMEYDNKLKSFRIQFYIFVNITEAYTSYTFFSIFKEQKFFKTYCTRVEFLFYFFYLLWFNEIKKIFQLYAITAKISRTVFKIISLLSCSLAAEQYLFDKE